LFKEREIMSKNPKTYLAIMMILSLVGPSVSMAGGPVGGGNNNGNGSQVQQGGDPNSGGKAGSEYSDNYDWKKGVTVKSGQKTSSDPTGGTGTTNPADPTQGLPANYVILSKKKLKELKNKGGMSVVKTDEENCQDSRRSIALAYLAQTKKPKKRNKILGKASSSYSTAEGDAKEQIAEITVDKGDGTFDVYKAVPSCLPVLLAEYGNCTAKRNAFDFRRGTSENYDLWLRNFGFQKGAGNDECKPINVAARDKTPASALSTPLADTSGNGDSANVDKGPIVVSGTPAKKAESPASTDVVVAGGLENGNAPVVVTDPNAKPKPDASVVVTDPNAKPKPDASVVVTDPNAKPKPDAQVVVAASELAPIPEANADLAAINKRLDDLEAKLDNVKPADLTAVLAEMKKLSDDVKAVQDKVNAAPVASPTDVAAFQKMNDLIAELSKKVDALEASKTVAANPAMEARMEKLEQSVEELKKLLTQVAPAASQKVKRAKRRCHIRTVLSKEAGNENDQIKDFIREIMIMQRKNPKVDELCIQDEAVNVTWADEVIFADAHQVKIVPQPGQVTSPTGKLQPTPVQQPGPVTVTGLNEEKPKG
jgi:hypothetical protein